MREITVGVIISPLWGSGLCNGLQFSKSALLGLIIEAPTLTVSRTATELELFAFKIVITRLLSSMEDDSLLFIDQRMSSNLGVVLGVNNSILSNLKCLIDQ